MITDLNKKMNYNLDARNVTKKSNLGDIQKMLIDLFFKKKNLTDEQISDFATNIYTNPDEFDPDIDYSSLKEVGPYFNECLKNYQQLNHEKETDKTTGKTM